MSREIRELIAAIELERQEAHEFYEEVQEQVWHRELNPSLANEILRREFGGKTYKEFLAEKNAELLEAHDILRQEHREVTLKVTPLLLVLLVAGALVWNFSGLTGLFTLSQEETFYRYDIGQSFQNNATLALPITRFITSMRLDGQISGSGTASVYLVSGQNAFLLSSFDGSQEAVSPLTGFVVDQSATDNTPNQTTELNQTNDTNLTSDVVLASDTNDTNSTNSTSDTNNLTVSLDNVTTNNETNASEETPAPANETNQTVENLTQNPETPAINETNNTNETTPVLNETNATNETVPVLSVNETNATNETNVTQTPPILNETNQTNETQPLPPVEENVTNETNQTNQTISEQPQENATQNVTLSNQTNQTQTNLTQITLSTKILDKDCQETCNLPLLQGPYTLVISTTGTVNVTLADIVYGERQIVNDTNQTNTTVDAPTNDTTINGTIAVNETAPPPANETNQTNVTNQTNATNQTIPVPPVLKNIGETCAQDTECQSASCVLSRYDGVAQQGICEPSKLVCIANSIPYQPGQSTGDSRCLPSGSQTLWLGSAGSGRIEIRSSNSTVAVIDKYGTMAIIGTSQFNTSVPSAGWQIVDPQNVTVLSIDEQGNLASKGSLTQLTVPQHTQGADYIVKDPAGAVQALIDQAGNLILAGNLLTQVNVQ